MTDPTNTIPEPYQSGILKQQTSPNLILTVKKNKVKFDGDFAVVDVGLTVEEFIKAVLEFATSPQEAMAVMKEGDE